MHNDWDLNVSRIITENIPFKDMRVIRRIDIHRRLTRTWFSRNVDKFPPYNTVQHPRRQYSQNTIILTNETLDIAATAGTGDGNGHSCHLFFTLGLFNDAFDCPIYATSNDRMIHCKGGKGSFHCLISAITPALARKCRKTSVTATKMTRFNVTSQKNPRYIRS